MAKIIAGFSCETPESYDWEAWADGHVRRFTRSLDYTTSSYAFASAAKEYAAAHGMTVRASEFDRFVELQFKPKEPM